MQGSARKDGLFGVGVENDGRKKPLREVREGKPIFAAAWSSSHHDRLDLLLIKAEPRQLRTEQQAPFLLVRTAEGQDLRRTPRDRGVERIVAVGAHDDCGRNAPVRETVDAPYERIDAADLLMLHLGSLAGLSERIRLIDQEDH